MNSFLYILLILNGCGILYSNSFLIPILNKSNKNILHSVAEPPSPSPNTSPSSSPRRRKTNGKKYIPSPEQQKEINSIFSDIYKKINTASMTPKPAEKIKTSSIPPSVFTEDEKTRKMVEEFQENYKKIMAGFDMRPPYYTNSTIITTTPSEDDVVIKYAEIFEKKKLLDKLEDPNVPSIEKLRLLGVKKFNYDEW